MPRILANADTGVSNNNFRIKLFLPREALREIYPVIRMFYQKTNHYRLFG
jgi:hypothetical protein